MAATSVQSGTTFINSLAELVLLLDAIANVAVDPPSLYIGLEGFDLGHHASVSILTLHVAPTQETYLIDIYTLGAAAFSTINSDGESLKSILESGTIPKIVFDIRNISHAIFSLFQISVDGIKEIQLMELATRGGSREFVSIIDTCIEKQTAISATEKAKWHIAKKSTLQPMTHERGGSCPALNERPLKLEIMQHCRQNVVLLPALFNVYNTKLRRTGEAFWRVHVRFETKARIGMSQSQGYDGSSKNFNRGWDNETIEREIDAWNEELMMESRAGTHVLNENDEWVLAPDDDWDRLLDTLENCGQDDYGMDDEEDRYDSGNDTARDCIGWEEDMIRNGSPL